MTKGKASITKATVINAFATLSPRASTFDLSDIEHSGTDFFIPNPLTVQHPPGAALQPHDSVDLNKIAA